MIWLFLAIVGGGVGLIGLAMLIHDLYWWNKARVARRQWAKLEEIISAHAEEAILYAAHVRLRSPKAEVPRA